MVQDILTRESLLKFSEKIVEDERIILKTRTRRQAEKGENCLQHGRMSGVGLIRHIKIDQTVCLDNGRRRKVCKKGWKHDMRKTGKEAASNVICRRELRLLSP